MLTRSHIYEVSKGQTHRSGEWNGGWVARGRGYGEGGGNREEPAKRYKVSGIRDEQFSVLITNNTVPYT